MKKICIYLIFLFGVLLIVFPEVCKEGVFDGIILCGKIIIPSLFPFMMCVIYIMNSDVLSKLKIINKITKLIFGMNSYCFSVFVLSFLGGYPVGAKFLSKGVVEGKIDPCIAKKMLCFCVNAGPAFIFSVVGNGILHSKSLGLIIFIAHCVSSVIMCLFLRLFGIIKYENETQVINKSLPTGDNFVISASNAAEAVIQICVFVILFSGINSYISFYSVRFPFLKYILYFTEISNAITHTNNIYLITFLLGFSGICIWFQIFYVAKGIKINYYYFSLSRIIHGGLSVSLIYILVKIFNISVSVSTYVNDYKLFYQTPTISICMLMTVIIFIISLTGKKYNGKINEIIV